MHRLGAGVVISALLAMGSNASAADFTVTDLGDSPLASPSGTACVSTHTGSCTLRAAVQAADNTPGTNTITLPAGHVKLTVAPTGASAGSDADDPAHGDLDVLNGDNLTITGAGSGSGSTAIDANEIDRAFAVQHGGALTLSKLAIDNGNPAQQSSGTRNGGAVYSNGGLTIAGDVALHDNSTFNHGDGGAIFIDTSSTASGVTGATFADNSASAGGAIWFDGGSLPLAVANSTFTGNQALSTNGGAIVDNSSGPFTVTSSTFSGNSTPTPGSTEDGGAIYDDDATGSPFTVTGSEFDHNASDFGSAIDDEESSQETISSTTFTDNTATTYGTIRIDNHVAAQNTLTGVEFADNRAGVAGGAVRWENGKLTIAGSSFVRNRAGMFGGGLFLGNSAAFSMTNSTVSGNRAFNGAGILINTVLPITLTNDTIALNVATPNIGGGISGIPAFAFSGSAVVNTIVADNTGGDCNQVFLGADSGNNLDSDGSCFGGLGVSSDKTMVDPLVSDAAANGGPVSTDALGSGSPAIDAANGSACPATDARGVPRPQGGGCDIGAFEASTPKATITSPTNHSRLTQGAVVKAGYSCSEAGLASLIASCMGPAAPGAAIDTSSPGSHTFTVTAIDDQGLLATAAVQYTVTLPPPPNTKIIRHHVSGDTLTVAFRGTGGSGALTFRCRLGKHGKFKRCTSPKAYAALSRGKHTVQIKAVDSAGQSDPTPATLHVRIRR